MPQISIADLLSECSDALQVPGWDKHVVGLIGQTLAESGISTDIRCLLERVQDHFQKHEVDPFFQTMDEKRISDGLVKEIGMLLDGKSHVYHGTIAGRLHGILREGRLVPGKAKGWDEKLVHGAPLDSSVFFTTTWRGAMFWAEIAQLRSRGRKASIKRKPAIVRLPAEGLALQPDRWANKSGCWMVAGSVPMTGASVLIGEVQGFPNWLQLEQAIRLLDANADITTKR